jgi:hypothetical protein
LKSSAEDGAPAQWDKGGTSLSRSFNRDASVTRRRPAEAPDAPVQARERFTLSLFGQHHSLVRNAANTTWVSRRGTEQLEVRETNGLSVG